MGANAQTTVPTFTTNQVLTADQMNQSARTGVPVFADTTARDAAFGGTGEKTLAEGQLCYVENLTGVAQIQYYDGTNWVSLSAGGVAFISSTTFTNVASIGLPAGTFTTTYLNYRVFINLTASSTNQTLGMRVNAAGTAQTASSYFQQRQELNDRAEIEDSGTTSANINRVRNANVFGSNVIDIFQPADSTIVTAWTYTGNGETTTGNSSSTVGGGFYNVAAAHDGLTFFVGGTMSGVIRVYGFANS